MGGGPGSGGTAATGGISAGGAGGAVDPTCPLDQSGVLDVDIKTVNVSGNVTVNGAAPPSGLAGTYLTFKGKRAWQLSNGAAYTATLLAGTYDVGVTTSDLALTSLPAQSAVLIANQRLTQSGALDVDIKTVDVSGNILVDGAAPPSGLSGTYLTFSGQNAWQLSKGGVYTARLLAGSYDVGVATSDAAITSLSKQSAVLIAKQQLTQSGALDVGIKTVSVSGNITVNGLAPPAGLGGTYLTFAGQKAWQLSKGASYKVTLLAGTYDVGVTASDDSISTVDSQSAVLIAKQQLTQSGALDVDIKTVNVSGNITVNGAPPPTGLGGTSVTFGGQKAWSLSNGAAYKVTLLAGTYDVGVATTDAAIATLDSQSVILMTKQQLTQSGSLDVDIKTVNVSGNVRVNGAAPPSGLAGTHLTFGGQNAWLLSNGAAYTAKLLAGTYDVGVSTSDVALTSLPTQSAVLIAKQQLIQSGALDIDIRTVSVSGDLTVNGSPPPSGLGGTYLTFGGQKAWQLSKGASYSATLLAGRQPVGVTTQDTPITSLAGGDSTTLPVCQ
jgi:hypothetical protein